MFDMRRLLLVGLIGAAVACGSVAEDGFDAGRDVTDSGAPVDGAVPVPDAGVIPRGETSEIAAGAGRVSGRVYTVDVQIGHGHVEGRRK